MKQRFTFLDIRAIINELKPKLINKFIQNFYTTQQRIIYIKFSSKDILLIEPGIRIHLTSEADDGISHFCNILRKKARRDKVINIYQVGFDRVIVFELTRQKIVVEFFSGGNVFILDENDKILEVFRVVKELDIVKNTEYLFNPVGFDFSWKKFCKMEFNEFLPFEKELVDKLMNKITKAIDNKEIKEDKAIDNYDDKQIEDKAIDNNNEIKEDKAIDNNEMEEDVQDKKGNIKNKDNMKDNNVEIKEDKCNTTDSDYKEKKDKKANNKQVKDNYKDFIKSQIIKNNKIDIFNQIMSEFYDQIQNLQNIGTVQLKKGKPFNFFPYEIASDNKLTFNNFNSAVEYFFSDRKKSKKQNIDKAQKVKDKQYEHIVELENMVEEMSLKADLVLDNEDLVEEIINIHKSVVKNKMKWDDFMKYQDDEKNKGNEVALSIIRSDFKTNSCIINLKNDKNDETTNKDTYDKSTNKNEHFKYDESNLNDKYDKSTDDSNFIEIFFDKSIHQNIKNFYEKKKKLQEKINKTKIAIETVKIKSFKKDEKVKIQRPVFWFEKFHFFFTTNKKLIIGGKNSQQNEILVKKYLLPTSLYFHTESSGGSSIICPNDVILEEAALAALCNSSCWDLNVISPVFYVTGDQVSKIPPTGQYLPKGSFLIRGVKNFLNVYKIEYGLGLLFKTSDDVKEGDFFIKYEDTVFITDPTGYEVDFALPMSGPYKIFKDFYKFKVRILPGKDKKGKVVQGIINEFIKNTEERVIKIIKRISVEEFMNVLPTNIKIGKEIK
ncbi:Rqc2 RqcH-like protein [Vairimorpha necatrix]|uniref:Rqc2 RqcH-like protein n=1 Tax=Vairimorpha necatrix TaxID=6039 RepID=A0AAX4JBV9_9MICR